MELTINHTDVFTKCLDAYEEEKRFVISQGGARSSKTYSLIQLLIFICLTKPNTKVSIVRKSFPSLRGSVLRDFVEIMHELNLYDVRNHNKTEQVYTFYNRSSIEFFSIDDAQKVRGRKRDICYCNEANELTFEDFQQLSLRTSTTLFLDFNPSDNEHWIYELLNDKRSCLIKSTYKDNLFLNKEIVEEIENLINVDHNYYLIYAMGERPVSTARIYTHFKECLEVPFGEVVYGLDFGYVDPTVLIRTTFSEGKAYVEELVYQSYLTTPELIKMIKEHVSPGQVIYADGSRPEIIEDIRRAGFNIKGASKAIKAGIDAVKSIEVYITQDSVNLWKESKKYSWKSKGEIVFDEPIDLDNHGCDSIRYSIYSHKKKPTGRYAIYAGNNRH